MSYYKWAPTLGHFIFGLRIYKVTQLFFKIKNNVKKFIKKDKKRFIAHTSALQIGENASKNGLRRLRKGISIDC